MAMLQRPYQLGLGAFSSVPSPRSGSRSHSHSQAGRSGAIRRKGRSPSCLYPSFTCLRPEKEEEEEEVAPRKRRGGKDVGRFLASHGRRGITFMAAIPFILPMHLMASADGSYEMSIIRKGISSVMSKAKAAGILRTVFHDAGTFDVDSNSGGINGSIIYELDRPENAGLSKSLKILEKAKMEIENIHQVSWADLIAVAGAEAVLLCGGPVIPLRLGRSDVRMPDPPGRLPEESMDAFGLKKCFLKKGFSTQELVALSGAHTIGSKGFGNPNVFDNAYYRILLEKPWTLSAGMSSMIGLPSDRAIVEDDECSRWIKIYAADQEKFLYDFKNAYMKLVNSGALWRIS